MIFGAVIIFIALCFDTLGTNARNLDGKQGGIKNLHERFLRQIVPGTKWCGNGDKASNDNDFGHFLDTDMCCREHDKCPMNIGAHETKYGLKNPDFSTRSHCNCDEQFFQCLRNTTSPISRTIGSIYFNLLKKPCFREKQCLLGMMCNNVEFEWVKANSWLPTEKELNQMYYNMGLIIPELEFD